jgi:pyruvate formate lyase activating enzyme
MSLTELMAEIEKDRLFYEMSGGGVTLTGGEPLYQPEFCQAILRSCKECNISTAMETSLFAAQPILDSVIAYVDHFLVDIKLLDSQMHRRYTGEDNAVVLENFQYLAERHSQIIVRIPLIKDITDTPCNIEAIEQFVLSVKRKIAIETLSYNPLTPDKYVKLGREFRCS